MVPKYLNKGSKAKGNHKKDKNGGPAENPEKPEEDKSILRQPIDIGIRGVKDLMKALAGGTTEFQDLLINECSVIYECKICYNLFRSLANFVSHKRVYCVKSFCYFSENFNPAQSESPAQSFRQNDVVVIPDMPTQNEQNVNDPDTWVTSDKTCSSESVTVGGLGTLTPRKKLDDLKVTRGKRQDITEILSNFKRRRENEGMKMTLDVPDSVYYSELARKMMEATPRPKTVVEVESINGSTASVFQTLKRPDGSFLTDSMKIQLIDIDRIVSKNQAILQENGTFVVTSEEMETEEEKNLEKHFCPLCDSSFLTEQTLSGHIQIYHKERICYPCPLCRIFLASTTGVYRHLSKAHHRTEQQIRRLRPQILSKARKRLLQTKDGCDIFDDLNKHLKHEEEEWLNNFEGELRCNGCGKCFNRRAVLNVHSLTCRKMLALMSGSASHTSTKAKSTSHAKSSTKSASPGKHSKSSKSKCGILVRKNYRKLDLEKPHTTSLAEAEMECAAGSSSSEISTEPVVPGPSNSKSHSSDKASTSSDNSSACYSTSSRKPSASKKKKSSNGAESKKGKKKTSKKNSHATSPKN